MKKIWNSYKSTILILFGIIIGSIVGLVFKEKANVLQPFGDIFINMMFVVIVPLVFLTITSSIAKMKNPKRLSKIMFSIVFVFVITSVVALLISFATTYKIKLVSPDNQEKIISSFEVIEETSEEITMLERVVSVLTVDDFSKLLSKNNLIALIVISIITGVAIRKSKNPKPILSVIESANDVIFEIINIVMIFAPIGLGCYFATLVGTLGSSIAIGYLKTFVLYTIVAILYYIIIYSIYAYISAGKNGLKAYWKNILPATFMSLATCSSAASIPVNTKCAKNMGVSDDIADTLIPLGTSFHKDGSIIGSLFKIMFLVCLFNTDISSFGNFIKILGVAAVANLLITGVPIGGGTISEMMIITLMGYPMECLPILTIIAVIIDAPATMLNVVGDTSSSMLVSRIVDGKNWLNKNSL